jgi:Protein kinase domain.
MKETIIAGKFKQGEKIGSGSFGEIHTGTNLLTHEPIAIKLESIQSKHPQLIYEAKILKSLEGGLGMPEVH